MENYMITLIAALAENNAIGNENKLLYWLPNDLKRFKALTTGNTIIMGRKTFDSLPKGALPNRRNIVLSRQKDLVIENAEVFNSLDEALAHCGKQEEIFIIGGASVYEEAIKQADRLCITHIEDTPNNADAFFPEISKDIWKITSNEVFQTDEKHQYAYRFTDYQRKTHS